MLVTIGLSVLIAVVGLFVAAAVITVRTEK
jgi:hypothetical protein